MAHCFSCQEVLVFANGVGRREECGRCGADVHVCKNCEFFEQTAYNECKEPQAENVREKDRSNFCDFFRLSSVDSPAGTSDKVLDQREKLRSQAEALFKNFGKK